MCDLSQEGMACVLAPGAQPTVMGWRGPHGSCFSTSWPAELKGRLQGRTGPSLIRTSGAGCVWIPVSVCNRGLPVPPNFEDLWESGRRWLPSLLTQAGQLPLGSEALPGVTGQWE